MGLAQVHAKEPEEVVLLERGANVRRIGRACRRVGHVGDDCCAVEIPSAERATFPHGAVLCTKEGSIRATSVRTPAGSDVPDSGIWR